MFLLWYKIISRPLWSKPMATWIKKSWHTIRWRNWCREAQLSPMPKISINCVQRLFHYRFPLGVRFLHGGSQTKYSFARGNWSSRQWWRLKGFQEIGYVCRFQPSPKFPKGTRSNHYQEVLLMAKVDPFVSWTKAKERSRVLCSLTMIGPSNNIQMEGKHFFWKGHMAFDTESS